MSCRSRTNCSAAKIFPCKTPRTHRSRKSPARFFHRWRLRNICFESRDWGFGIGDFRAEIRDSRFVKAKARHSSVRWNDESDVSALSPQPQKEKKELDSSVRWNDELLILRIPNPESPIPALNSRLSMHRIRPRVAEWRFRQPNHGNHGEEHDCAQQEHIVDGKGE